MERVIVISCLYYKVIPGHLLPALIIYEGDEQEDRQDLLG